MAAIYLWSIFIILYQTVICVIFTWLTLGCQLAPEPSEPRELTLIKQPCDILTWLTLACQLTPEPSEPSEPSEPREPREPRELTLIKMLYLFEPETCNRQYYYNYTMTVERKQTVSTIVWLESNWVAASFRNKMKLWMGLHISWLGLALLNVSLGRRPCGFYAILLPLTTVGISLLVVDLVHAGLFLHDAIRTRTESQIWDYIGTEYQLRSFPSLLQNLNFTIDEADTSWVSLLFAYASLRGIVQWIVNFWIVQDNYFDGLHYYRELGLQAANKRRGY